MSDQAQRLRELVWNARNQARVLAVTSGKGGVGKTNTSVNLAIALAARGQRVILMDADLGLANVEVLMGLNSSFNIENVIDGDKKMREILVQGPGGILLVPGSSGLSQMADLTAAGRQNLLEGIHELQDLAHFVIIDTMAGIGRNAVAFAAAADEVLLVSTPEPSAIVDAYAMLKTVHAQRNDALVRLVVNMAASDAQAQAVVQKLSGVSQQYLGRPLGYLGCIPRDPHVAHAVMRSQPFAIAYPQSPAARAMHILAARLAQQAPAAPARDGFFRRFAATFGLASSA